MEPSPRSDTLFVKHCLKAEPQSPVLLWPHVTLQGSAERQDFGASQLGEKKSQNYIFLLLVE